MPAEYNAKNGKELQRIKQNGTQVLPFDRVILESAYQETQKLYEEYANSHQSFSALYSQWKTFRTQVYSWNQINELSFDRFTMQTIP